MKQIFLNTLKITFAAVMAILIARLLKLEFAVSAGIVAILSVQPTKKETLKTAFSRFLAFAVALVISGLLFNFCGFTVPVFFIYLAVFILICQWRGWISSMAMDSVLISHLLSLGKTGPSEILNEVLLFVVGVGFGILVNIFLHKKTDYIEELKNQTDEKIKLVLHRMSLRILNPSFADYDGTCFDSLNQNLFIAKKQAEENFNNQFTSRDTFDTRYLLMRENQTKVLYEMFKCVRHIKTVPGTAQMVADFLEKVSVEYHKDNDVQALLTELEEIRNKMKTVPLPVHRAEFEDRANLFTLLERLQEFLEIKRDFYLNNIN
ncbi:aromatic acid exporter family protein [Treponema bryantii]|uniref:aromatic acid exporter family protein n=1 Tax=Treponema bryantii TaxID=163 RepID=UPI002B31D0E3|nr:membrane protein [Treponema bryantii]